MTRCRGLTFRWFVLSPSSNVKQSKNSSTLEYKSTPLFRKAGNSARYDTGSPFFHPMLQQCYHQTKGNVAPRRKQPTMQHTNCSWWSVGLRSGVSAGSSKTYGLTEEKAVAQVSESVVTERPCMTGRCV